MQVTVVLDSDRKISSMMGKPQKQWGNVIEVALDFPDIPTVSACAARVRGDGVRLKFDEETEKREVWIPPSRIRFIHGATPKKQEAEHGGEKGQGKDGSEDGAESGEGDGQSPIGLPGDAQASGSSD